MFLPGRIGCQLTDMFGYMPAHHPAAKGDVAFGGTPWHVRYPLMGYGVEESTPPARVSPLFFGTSICKSRRNSRRNRARAFLKMGRYPPWRYLAVQGIPPSGVGGTEGRMGPGNLRNVTHAPVSTCECIHAINTRDESTPPCENDSFSVSAAIELLVKTGFLGY